MLRYFLAIFFLAGSAFESPAADRRLECGDFISACFLAGGASNPSELAELKVRYRGLLQRIDFAALRDLPSGARAGKLHAQLHGEILSGGYQSDASDLRRTMYGGDYNCLSAAAIYLDLCDRAGFEVQVWSRPGHVCIVDAAGDIVVEPGAKSWRTSSAARTSALPTQARQITPTQLIGKFYYNRGLLLLRQGRHAEGLVLVRTSLQLDPGDREARANLLAGLNNWAVALSQQERFPEARLLIGQGLAIDPDYSPLVANARYVRAHRSP